MGTCMFLQLLSVLIFSDIINTGVIRLEHVHETSYLIQPSEKNVYNLYMTYSCMYDLCFISNLLLNV